MRVACPPTHLTRPRARAFKGTRVPPYFSNARRPADRAIYTIIDDAARQVTRTAIHQPTEPSIDFDRFFFPPFSCR